MPVQLPAMYLDDDAGLIITLTAPDGSGGLRTLHLHVSWDADTTLGDCDGTFILGFGKSLGTRLAIHDETTDPEATYI